MRTEDRKFEIDEEFADLIPPHSDEELSRLEESIQRDGCRDPLVVWSDEANGKNLLIDGHQRLTVCERHDLAYNTVPLERDTRDEALLWSIENQHARRNLTDYSRGLLSDKFIEIERRMAIERKRVGGSAGGVASGLSRTKDPHHVAEPSTMKPAKKRGRAKSKTNGESRARAAKRAGTSHETARRAKWVHERVDPETEKKLREGKTTVGKEYNRLQREEKTAAIRKKIAAQPPPDSEDGPFDVLIVDPPWRSVECSVDTTQCDQNMTREDLQAYDLPSKRAKPDSLLWLWAPNEHMHDAFHVVESWGFVPVTILTWEKNKTGSGDWLRGKTEHCIMAVRGEPSIELKNQTTLLRGKAVEHPRKPEEFYELVHLLCPGSKVEFFARESHEGIVPIGEGDDAA